MEIQLLRRVYSSMEEKSDVSFLSWGILLVLSIIWGSSFILIKKSLVAFSFTEVGLLRISISGLAFLPFMYFFIKKIDKKDLTFLLIVGLTGSGIPAFLFPLAQTQISSSVAGLLNSLTPLFTLIIGIFFFNRAFKWSKLAGIFVGFIGALFLIIFNSDSLGVSHNIVYALFAILATLCYATNVNMVGSHLKHLDAITISAVSFTLLLPPALLALFTTDFIGIIQHHPSGWQSLGAIVILSLLGTVISTIIFFQLVRYTNALFASTISYVIPIVALSWGVVDGEAIDGFHFLGMALILVGVYVSKR